MSHRARSDRFGRLALVATLSSVALAAMPASATVLTGTIRYANEVVGPTGFVAADSRPARRLLVEIVDLALSAEIVGIAYTDQNGRFTTDVGIPVGGRFGLLFLAKTDATGEVRDSLGAVYNWSNLAASPTIASDPFDVGTVTVTRAEDAGALNILDMVTAGHEFASLRTGETPPPLVAVWRQGVRPTCGTCYADGTLYVSSEGDGATADTDEYDDTLVLRQVARHLSRHLGCDASPGGTHGTCQAGEDPRLAWSEGLASWLAVNIALASPAVDDTGASWVDTVGNLTAGSSVLARDDLEANDTCGDGVYGANNEGAVERLLWDLSDRPLDGPDDYERSPNDLLSVVTKDLDPAGNCDLAAFTTAWCGRYGAADGGLFAAVFDRFGVASQPPCPPRYGLRVARTGTGQGRVTAAAVGLDCGPRCAVSQSPGTFVELTASADPGSVFAGFSGDADCADGAVTVDAPRSCVARFDSAAGCRADAHTLCLLGGRYRLEVAWENQYAGTSGRGLALPYADLTGFFAFDDAANVELVVKILDFGGAAGVRLFYGQLTDLRFTLTLTEMASGRQRVYVNGTGECGGIGPATFSPGSHATFAKRLAPGAADEPVCQSAGSTLCLLEGRFAVTVDWRNQFNGASGAGAAAGLSELSGLFTFTDPANVELLVKTLDFGDRVLFLWGALSDLGYSIHLRDVASGEEQTYVGPPGRFCGGLDDHAF
jgi:hypothetical protein